MLNPKEKLVNMIECNFCKGSGKVYGFVNFGEKKKFVCGKCDGLGQTPAVE